MGFGGEPFNSRFTKAIRSTKISDWRVRLEIFAVFRSLITGGKATKKVDRRSALTIALATAASAVVTKHATAQHPTASAGKEIAPGVRQADPGKARASIMPACKNASTPAATYTPTA